jgi:5-formyltetrahydrofolate cyclo-ligase
MDKKILRKEFLARRSELSLEEREEKSTKIADLVIALEAFEKSDKVLLYAPIRGEVETEKIYRSARLLSKDVYYPRVQGKEMEFYLVNETTEYEMSRYGIKEPKPESTIAYEPKVSDRVFVVIPGAAFDREGNRIGYGGGYYDKYLHWLKGRLPSEQICKVAVAYECQMVETGNIEKELYDVQMDYILTEVEEIKI